MDGDTTPTSSCHDQSLDPKNPSNESSAMDVDASLDTEESNKRRKITTQEEIVHGPSIDTAIGGKKEKRISLRRRVQKFFFNVDLPTSSDEDDDPYHGNTVVSYSDSDCDEALEMKNGVRLMNKAERAEYYRQIEESKGFDVDDFPGTFVFDGLVPVYSSVVRNDPIYRERAQDAINLRKDETGEKFELMEIVKVNQQLCGFHDYYFTLKLRDETGCEGKYRAKIEDDWEKEEIRLAHWEKVVSGEDPSAVNTSTCCD